jgi:hypothetical protein
VYKDFAARQAENGGGDGTNGLSRWRKWRAALAPCAVVCAPSGRCTVTAVLAASIGPRLRKVSFRLPTCISDMSVSGKTCTVSDSQWATRRHPRL